jgi:hypothetical protein
MKILDNGKYKVKYQYELLPISMIDDDHGEWSCYARWKSGFMSMI